MTQKRTQKPILIILFFIFLFSGKLVVISQNNVEFSQAIDSVKFASDKAYGLDFELANGPIYYQKNLFAAGNPFYGSSDWFEGEVYINGNSHKGLQLKYNIENDQLIILVTLKSGLATTIILTDKHVESFMLGQQKFKSTNWIGTKDIPTLYIHEIYEGSFMLLASYSKNFINDYNTKTPYGKYSERQSTYFILEDDVITKVGNKKSLLNYFESHKKEINKYMKKNGFKYNKASSQQWHSLVKYCDELKNSSSR